MIYDLQESRVPRLDKKMLREPHNLLNCSLSVESDLNCNSVRILELPNIFSMLTVAF